MAGKPAIGKKTLFPAACIIYSIMMADFLQVDGIFLQIGSANLVKTAL